MGSPFCQGKICLGLFIIPEKTLSYTDMIKQNIFTDSDIDQMNERRVSAIIDSDNSIAAKMQEIEIIKFLTNYQEISVLNKQVVIDTSN